MSKKNKNTGKKNRQYHFNDKVIQPRQELSKFVFRSKRKLFRKISKQNSKMIILKIFMSLIKILQSLKNNIKYIIFQAYFLCFCIFSTISSKFINSKKYIEKTHKDSTDEKYESSDEEKKIKTEQEEGNTKKENSKNKDKNELSLNKNHKGKENNDDNDKIITTKENFDSSTELWNIANDTIIMNMKIQNEDINKSIECKIAEEPVGISIEHIVNNMNSEIITSQENELSATNNDFHTQFSKSFIDEQDSISSIDEEEDEEIFQKQYNSSEDEFKSSSFHRCCASCKCKRSKQNNFYCRKVINNYSHNSPFISESKNEERMKKTEYTNDKRKKVISYENEKYIKYKNDKNTKEEKSEPQKNVSPKDKSCFSRVPIKFNKLKYKNIKYKEMATQTDNSLLIDDDVEIITTDRNGSSEQQFYCKSQFNHFQGKVIVQELNYIADNEESSIGFLRIAHKQITSCSTSSSSTDFGFDEDTSIIPDMNSAITHINISNNANTSPRCTRPPPGFPEIPQNRPLLSYNDPINFILASSTYENSTYNSFINTVTIVPPMPHLYYDYPEFMDFPTYNNFSETLDNILEKNYE